MPLQDSTLSILFGFLLAAGGGCWKAYQVYLARKDRLRNEKTSKALTNKNKELNATKRLNKELSSELKQVKAENQSLRETLQSCLARRPEP